METLVNYTELKFSNKEYKFSSKKEMGNFFDEAWIQNPANYKRMLKEYMNENIHVFFSWALLLKYVSYSLLLLVFIATLSTAPIMGSILLGASLFSLLISKYFSWKVKEENFSKEFTLSVLTPEMLEAVRKELIKMKSCETK